MKVLAIALLDYCGLAGRWRAQRRTELLEYLGWNHDLTLVNVQCPGCKFINPSAADHLTMVCGWCGADIEEPRVHG